MRQWIVLSLLVFMSLVLFACRSRSVEVIDADTALELLEDPSIVLLDVREYDEYITERIEGSTLLSLSVIESLLENRYPDKETTFIVYCRSGRRSAEALQIMQELGYENLYDLGGIISWPYDTVSGPPS